MAGQQAHGVWPRSKRYGRCTSHQQCEDEP